MFVRASESCDEHGMWSYIKRRLSMAFWHSFGPIDFWTALASTTLGVADHLAPNMHLMTQYAWQIPLWVCGAIIAVRLMLSPYWINQEDAAEIAQFKTKLSDRGNLEVRFEANQSPLERHEFWGVGIFNSGPAAADNVTVTLL